MHTYHEKRRNDPINHNTKPNLDPERLLPKRPMQSLIPNLAQNRVHHHQQPDGFQTSKQISTLLPSVYFLHTSHRILTNRYRNPNKLPPFQRRSGIRHEIPEDYTYRHSEEDPDSEEAVEDAQLVEGRSWFAVTVIGGVTFIVGGGFAGGAGL